RSKRDWSSDVCSSDLIVDVLVPGAMATTGFIGYSAPGTYRIHGAMAESGKREVTQLLSRWSAGDRAALDSLVPVVYGELRRMARSEERRVGKGLEGGW